MSTLSTHVLDSVRGTPAAGIAVTLFDAGDVPLAEAVTDHDGRIVDLGAQLPAGTYRLRFGTGDYFTALGQEHFHPEVVVTFRLAADGHCHVPLLLSPFAYSTYRGS